MKKIKIGSKDFKNYILRVFKNKNLQLIGYTQIEIKIDQNFHSVSNCL